MILDPKFRWDWRSLYEHMLFVAIDGFFVSFSFSWVFSIFYSFVFVASLSFFLSLYYHGFVVLL